MGEKILLVEDNPITRRMVRTVLERYTVIEAADGAAAIAAFADPSITMVLQDLVLPDMDGFELVSRLRAMPRGSEVPILAFSGLLSKLEEARVSSVEFDDLISKPIEPSRLLQIVRTHLPAAVNATHGNNAHGLRVLIADDDPVQRKLVTFRLQKLGFIVHAVADGMDALDALKSGNLPDAVISDVLMPRLDGFGLCVEIRRNPMLAALPVILITNSYVERADEELARRAGANALILRTPELTDVFATLQAGLKHVAPATATATATTAVDPELEQERMRRVMRQLDRQVALNASVRQRCAVLSAEISVLNGISGALATQESIEGALRHALAACFDAGGISMGALCLPSPDGDMRVLGFGAVPGWNDEELRPFIAQNRVVRDCIETQTVQILPSLAVAEVDARALLERARASSALVLPLGYKSAALGALIMVSSSQTLDTDDKLLFGQAVAGQISQALAVARAFAEKAASERVAREQAAVLHSILESIGDGIVVCDREGKIIRWNPAAAQILHVDGNALDSASTQEALTPLARAIRGESIDRMEMFVRHERLPDGAWLNVNAQPLRDDTGEVSGGVLAMRDVTIEKRAQAQLLVSDRMASVGMLAAGVAHEINTPLAAVVANLDLCKRELALNFGDMPSESMRAFAEMLDDARGAADRVRQIVRDLKVFSRHEETAPAIVEVERVLESTLRMAFNEIRHRARLVKHLTPQLFIEGSESRIGQVFLNLIVNAAHAIVDGNVESNQITLTTRMTHDNRVMIEVSDTGSGITPEALAQLFQPFFTTKPPGVGTGLGLAICQRIVSGLGGEIQVESELGRGSTFRVLLPAARRKASDSQTNIPAASPSGRHARILVVDDEPMIGRAIKRTFGTEHDIHTTTEGQVAVERIEAGERFDMILCDLMMPQMTGMELHAELSRIAPDQADRMVFLTGGAFTAAARAFLDEVSNLYIDKPFDPTQLRALVNARLAQRDVLPD